MTSALRMDPQLESIDTRLFGTLTVAPRDVIAFPNGVPGFPDATRFVLLDSVATPLYWLQSADDSDLALLLVDYDRVGPSLHAGSRAFGVVTLPVGDRGATANLRAPVLIDMAAGAGEQMILMDASLATAAAIDLDSLSRERRTPRS